MTAKTIKLPSLPAGLTISCKVRNPATLAVLETVSLSAGIGDDVSVYSGTVAGAHAGQLLFEVLISGVVVEKRIRTITDTAGPFVILTELEQLRNNGRGAHAVAITVTDGTDPIENATVRITSGLLSESDDTNAAGMAFFALNAATYAVTITCVGYGSHTATLMITGPATPVYSLSSLVVTPPASPLVSTGVMKVLDQNGQGEAGVSINVQLVIGRGVAGYALDQKVKTDMSDSNGDVLFPNLIRGATYEVWAGEIVEVIVSPFTVQPASSRARFVVPNADTFNIAEILRLDEEL